jgi:uncharacterized membrane protein YhaH (DUF805 family)
MGRFLIAGGWSTWMVLLLGGICLVCAVRFAWRPDGQRLPIVRALTWATVFAILAGLASNLIAVLSRVSSDEPPPGAGPRHQMLLAGVAESLTTVLLGFTVLALTWMFVAVGMRRMQDRGE